MDQLSQLSESRFSRRNLVLLSVLMLVSLIAQVAYAQDFPRPLSEYAESIAPNQVAFLSYPKYYTNTSGRLAPVETTLRASSDPNWDYEVVTGIWRLFVRRDGTFQAEHEGDVFAYKLSNIGLGRGDEFRPLELGDADWSRFAVIGDTVRWSEVFPDVDLRVRYIHHMLKVDVIVKEALAQRILTEAGVERDGFLTVRFAIEQLMLRSEARQNGEPRDLYGAPTEVNEPVYFERNGVTRHVLRPVEVAIENDAGETVFDGALGTIRAAQWWQLRPEGRGFAETSAHLGDLLDAPADDIPTQIWDSEGDHDHTRFTLRRHQNGTDNRILLLFCNFNDDQTSHSTYIHFRNHTITQVEPIAPHLSGFGSYALEDNNKTLRFNPNPAHSTDVYAHGYFLTLQ